MKKGKNRPDTLTRSALNILIVANNASARMGGEAVLPFHYFRLLRKRSVNVRLVTHERVKNELRQSLVDDFDRIHFVSDTRFQILAHRVGSHLPRRVADITTGMLISMSTGIRHRRQVNKLIAKYKIDIVHQPTPVSPKQPSFLFGIDAPVVIGPMNGGMTFPKAFRGIPSISERITTGLGRQMATIVNYLIPGKREAALLLVANKRTRDSLPDNVSKNIKELVENGVDFSLWDNSIRERSNVSHDIPTFSFLGFLKDWKGVDYLLHATANLLKETEVNLDILGTGPEESRLRSLAAELGISHNVSFHGFIPQKECPAFLKASRALILPSLHECGGAVVLEAMAMGLPVIATNWGGPADYLTSECGILIEPSSPNDFIVGLTEAMRRLTLDLELAERMGGQGKLRVQRLFDWEAKISQMLVIYSSILGRS